MSMHKMTPLNGEVIINWMNYQPISLRDWYCAQGQQEEKADCNKQVRSKEKCSIFILI